MFSVITSDESLDSAIELSAQNLLDTSPYFGTLSDKQLYEAALEWVVET